MTTDARIEAARHLIVRLAAASGSACARSEVDAVMTGLAEIATEVQKGKETDARLDGLAETLFGLATLDFGRRAKLHDDGSVLDAVVACVNMLAEELISYTEERGRIERDLERRVGERTTELHAAAEFLRNIFRTMPGALFLFDRTGKIEAVNEAALRMLDFAENELVGAPAARIFETNEVSLLDDIAMLERRSDVLRAEKTFRDSKGGTIPVLVSATTLPGRGGTIDQAGEIICVAQDIRDRRRLEIELRQAQKLEAIGRLAAGIAHEINTPVQFVSDSIQFVRDAMDDILSFVENYRAANGGGDDRHPAEPGDEEDLAYVLENVPSALNRSLEGLDRIAKIVRSMKQFAHPDRVEMTSVDLNEAIRSTATIANNEYKYVADVEFDFGEIPLVRCHGGDVNQVILNIIVNAAHAIEDVVKVTESRGRITVRTWRDGDSVVMGFADTGGGIPAAIRHRVFDPFFTTKEVGRGTGQGLAIAHSVVVDKHGGDLTFQTELGKGTTFFVRLPIEGKRPVKTTSA